MQKKICAVYGEGAVTDQMCQKWFAKFLGNIDILAKQFSAVVLSYVWENVQQHPWPLPSRSQQRETADILRYSKSLKLLVKMKNVLFILRKKCNRLFGQPNKYPSAGKWINELQYIPTRKYHPPVNINEPALLPSPNRIHHYASAGSPVSSVCPISVHLAGL